MATICLVACARKKRAESAPAQRLYDSPLFSKSAALARLTGDRWYILSAKYGLLSPSEVIEPYDETLKGMPNAEKLTWAKRVFEQLLAVTQPADKVVFLAGNDYRKDLEGELRRRGYSVEVPMEGMPIGKQLSWLNKAIAGAQPEA